MTTIKPVAYIHYWIGGYPPDGYIEESELLTPFQAEAYKDLESNEAHGISPLYAIPDGYHIVAIDHEHQAQRKRNYDNSMLAEVHQCCSLDAVKERMEIEIRENISQHNEKVRGNHED